MFASIHLAEIRYMLFLSLALDGGGVRFGQVRDRISLAMQDIGLVAILWEFFDAYPTAVTPTF
ncbi:MAG: hypothetical protein JXR23_10705 [Pontiellaceae bacterium]|nr:hypothetical protein [Pontiellaceae bacterium]